MKLEIDSVVAATFAPHVHTKFCLLEPPRTALELIEVSDGSTPRHITFSLVFRGPKEPLLPQRIYSLEHEALGQLDIFLVPLERDANGLKYYAVFNRVGEAAGG